jgi:hypothetical protein
MASLFHQPVIPAVRRNCNFSALERETREEKTSNPRSSIRASKLLYVRINAHKVALLSGSTCATSGAPSS